MATLLEAQGVINTHTEITTVVMQVNSYEVTFCDLSHLLCRIGISPRMQKAYVVMNLILGFCRPRASARRLLMAAMNIQVQCPVLLWVWLQFELV